MIHKINVYNIINNSDAITAHDGQLMYDIIKPYLINHNYVNLNFEYVTVFAAPFFIAAIGQLLKDFTKKEINHYLGFSNMLKLGFELVRLVMKNAERYYTDVNYKEAQNEVIDAISKEN